MAITAVIAVPDRETEALSSRIDSEMGTVLLAALRDPLTVEVLLNADGSLWQECLGKPACRIGTLSRINAMQLFGTIAHSLGEVVGAAHPILEGKLVNCGARFEGCIPPVSVAPVFAIRKPPSVIFRLEDYLEAGMLDRRQFGVVERVVRRRGNLLVAGSTGSGKTTFANALLDRIAREFPSDRVVVLEDTPELQVRVENSISLCTSRYVTLRDLLRATLRLRPDRIVVGETRGGEALDLLKAWNTGHRGGVSTIHANSARAGLLRLEELCAEVTERPSPGLIAEAVDTVLFLSRDERRGRRLREILTVRGYDRASGVYLLSGVRKPARTNSP